MGVETMETKGNAVNVFPQEPASTTNLRGESPPLDEDANGADTKEPSSLVQENEEPLDKVSSGANTQEPASSTWLNKEPLEETRVAINTTPQEPMSTVEQEEKLEETQA